MRCGDCKFHEVSDSTCRNSPPLLAVLENVVTMVEVEGALALEPARDRDGKIVENRTTVPGSKQFTKETTERWVGKHAFTPDDYYCHKFEALVP